MTVSEGYALIQSRFREHATPGRYGESIRVTDTSPRAWSLCLGQENSRLPESDRDGVAFRERTQAAPTTGMGDLRKHLPALAQHLPDVSIHLFHAEESLPMVGSVPASLVRKRLDPHSKLGPENSPRNRTSRFSLRSEVKSCTKGSKRLSPSCHRACHGPCAARREGEPPLYGGVIPERISVLTRWIC